jgi:hypothetical protein
LYSKFLNDNSNILKNFNKYLFCLLHDSWIIDLEIKSDLLILTLNDFSTHVFADAIVDKFNIDIEHEKLIFPLILELKGNLSVEFYKVDSHGYLKRIEQISVDEYLYEQVLNLDQDSIEIVFVLWHNNPIEDMPGERVLMIVSSKELNLTENQDIAWIEIFGDKYNEYYQYFKEQFDSERYVSDYTQCMNLVDEFEEINKMPTA